MKLEELVKLEVVDALLEPVVAVKLEVVVFVEPWEIVDDVAVEEDDTVDVRTVDEADCVVVLLPDGTTVLLADDVPLKLPVVVLTTELLEDVEVGEAVVVPLELSVAVLMTGLLEELEVRDVVVVPLNVETNEDEEAEVDEVFDVAGAVGPEGPELLVLLPYGAPLEVELKENPLEGPVVWEVEFTAVVLLFEIPLEVEDWVVRGAVGPRVIVLLVLLPYGAPVLEMLEEKPVDAMMEVALAVPVGTIVVLLTGPTALVEEEELLVVRGAVGPSVIELLVLLPYGAPLLEAVEEKPVDATLEVTLAVLVARLLVLLLETMTLVEDG
jgi:hypothetical protein